MFEDDYNAQRAKMSRSIPGQSLTNDPENPAPYEQAPEMTNALPIFSTSFSRANGTLI